VPHTPLFRDAARLCHDPSTILHPGGNPFHSLRRLSKSPGVVLSVVFSIGLGIQVANQALVDHVSLDKIPLAVASTAKASIIGVVKDIKSAPSVKKPAPYFSARSTRQVGSSGTKIALLGV
jgi:hypothetical protein